MAILATPSHPQSLSNIKTRWFFISEENDLILDPFIGSGTTAVAAIKHNRNYIGIEKEAKYVKLAKKRIRELSSFQLELNLV
ncbi:DNA methyltransferase [Coleofasciculus sp. F4-SAH-05]|uniref:DNA methyltransferase n=1 Tax=Coleofasciculus sp. F4-SAH-05 TaxID=3069525 RepID=UPI0032F59D0A